MSHNEREEILAELVLNLLENPFPELRVEEVDRLEDIRQHTGLYVDHLDDILRFANKKVARKRKATP